MTSSARVALARTAGQTGRVVAPSALDMTDELDTLPAPLPVQTLEWPGARTMPAIVTDAGPAARFAWDEFFAGQLRNSHTRKAYARAVTYFLRWLEAGNVPLVKVTPGMV